MFVKISDLPYKYKILRILWVGWKVDLLIPLPVLSESTAFITGYTLYMF